MKYLLFFASCFLVNIVAAQVPELPKNDKPGLIKTQPLTKVFPHAKLLHTTDKGKVYALPKDNMPCLVPHVNSNMPIANLGLDKYKKIPNALPEQKIIPENEVLNPREKTK